MEEIFKFAQWRVGAKAGATGNTMLEFMRDDQELLRQLAKGNEKAFKTLYDRYQGPIYRFALHMSGNRATAEETTQEVFTRIITNSKGYDAARGSVSSYLFGIARNIARRAIQDVSSELALEEESLDQDEFAIANGLDVLQDLTNTELVTALRAAVLALPQQYREAVVLCDLEEMSYQEAAELLQCSPGTIASRVHRGRNILKKKLSCEKCVK